MHEPVRSQLEDILQGRLKPGVKAVVSAHLKECARCTAELGQMGLHADLLRTLKAPEVPDLSAGFYARVLQRVEAQGRPSFWTLFVDPVFGRRLVYATGSMFLLMASFLLATSGNDSELAQTPVEMMSGWLSRMPFSSQQRLLTGGVVVFVGVGSEVGEPTLARLVNVVPLAGAVTVRVRFVACDAAKVPTDQITSFPFVAPPPVALTKVTPVGNASVTVTLAALARPMFVTVMV